MCLSIGSVPKPYVATDLITNYFFLNQIFMQNDLS